MPIPYPPLPWAEDALEPFISAATIAKHYGAHHKAYVEKGNKLIEGTKYADLDHAEIIRQAAEDPEAKAIFNNAAQAFNHERYWESLAPGALKPAGGLAARAKVVGRRVDPLSTAAQGPRDQRGVGQAPRAQGAVDALFDEVDEAVFEQ